ncbi:aBC-type multidrug transport system ATPase component [Coprobacillus sp. CAG:826]|nr:ABC transporter ATP-binding protein [Coprobacillus sp.]CDD91468.1 aBC-type multidrug transport system ATPase component [Coprobacillus sp. CAG:826]
MEHIIEIKNLHKRFNDVHAVNNLSFHVNKGELFAFLGVNGAGKSTTISILCGTLKKDSGEIYVEGHNADTEMDQIKDTIGVVFQNSVLDSCLSVKDNLYARASLYGLYGKEAKKRIEELAELLDFKDLMNRIVGKLSGGQRRRIDIARALLHHPKILILDEPTTGLDPKTRKLLWEVVEKCRKEENMTVFLTTHYMEEAADADYVIILDSGRIVVEGTPLELKNKYTGDYITFYHISEEAIQKLNLPYQAIRDAYRVEVKDTKAAKELILENPNLFDDFEITKGKMDDVFLSVTGKKLEGGN